MKKIGYVLFASLGVLLGACSGLDNGQKYPPPQHLPSKADRFDCSRSHCDVIPVTIGLDATRKCTAHFDYQLVLVEGGQTAKFALFKLQSDVQFRFASNPPGIEIDYSGEAPVFRLGGDPRIAKEAGNVRSAPEVPGATTFAVEALPDRTAEQRRKPYPFRINTEWLDGTRWSACTEIDPLIGNY